MIDEKYILLIQKHIRNELSPADQLELQNWLDRSEANRQILQDMEKAWQLAEAYQARYVPDVERGLQTLKERIRGDQRSVAADSPNKFRSLFISYSIAATILLLLAAFAVWNFWLRPVVVTTAFQEQQTIILPDGSTVILNQNSQLTYPRFFRNNRPVRISGEAYFDIVRDEQRPFTIATAKTKTEVLGTSFNLRAYHAEPFTEVEVLKGVVRLSAILDEQHPLELKEGFRGTYRHENGTIVEDHPKILNSVYWKDRRFRFKGHQLQEALEEINSRLHIQVQLTDSTLRHCSITQSIPLTTAADLVEIIADNFGSQWQEVEKGKFEIRGGNCNQ